MKENNQQFVSCSVVWLYEWHYWKQNCNVYNYPLKEKPRLCWKFTSVRLHNEIVSFSHGLPRDTESLKSFVWLQFKIYSVTYYEEYISL